MNSHLMKSYDRNDFTPHFAAYSSALGVVWSVRLCVRSFATSRCFGRTNTSKPFLVRVCAARAREPEGQLSSPMYAPRCVRPLLSARPSASGFESICWRLPKYYYSNMYMSMYQSPSPGSSISHQCCCRLLRATIEHRASSADPCRATLCRGHMLGASARGPVRQPVLPMPVCRTYCD